MSIGEILKQLRIKKEVTQLEVAKYIGVNFQTIYKYEKNIVVPPAETLVKLADFFNVTTDYILGRTLNEPIEIAANMKDKADLSDMSDKDKQFILDMINRLKNDNKNT